MQKEELRSHIYPNGRTDRQQSLNSRVFTLWVKTSSENNESKNTKDLVI